MPNCNLITSSGGITNKGSIMGQFSKLMRPARTSKKLADDGPVTVTDGSFTASLDPRSATTFVADGTP